MDFFDINSVCIIWASNKAGKIWNSLLNNMSWFTWNIFWVNKNGGKYKDLEFYTNIYSLPLVPDIAVICIPMNKVIDVLKECWEFWIRRVVIISSWFKEVWNNKEENLLKDIAERYNIHILWPNCLWYIDMYKSINISFWWKKVTKGNISIISQSWAIAIALPDWGYDKWLGFSKIISIWNKTVLWEEYFLEELKKDDKTDIIAIYIENIDQLSKLLRVCESITLNKSVVILKAWNTHRWSIAAWYHTGTIPDIDPELTYSLQKKWVHCVEDLEYFQVICEALVKTQDIKLSRDLAIVTNAWWPGVIATDLLENKNIHLTNFHIQEQKILSEWMPNNACMNNPLDIVWDATSARYKQMLDNIVVTGRNISLYILLTPQIVTDVDEITDIIIDFKEKNPGMLVVVTFMWWFSIEASKKKLKNSKILYANSLNIWAFILHKLLTT